MTLNNNMTVTDDQPANRQHYRLGYSPFCMQLLDLFFSYQAVLLFQQPCVTLSIGSPFHSESPTRCLLTYKCLHGLAPPYLPDCAFRCPHFLADLSCMQPTNTSCLSTHPDSNSRTASILLVRSCIVELAAGIPSGPCAQSQRVP